MASLDPHSLSNTNLLADKWERTAGDTEDMFEMTGGTGALMYMPPEAMLGTKYNHKVDVYSFAIIAWELVHYEMLIGRVANSSRYQEDLRRYAKFVAYEVNDEFAFQCTYEMVISFLS